MADGVHPQSDRARLERVEESLAFAERTVEQLSAEIADMNRKMAGLMKRVAAVEERMGKVEQGGEDEESEKE